MHAGLLARLCKVVTVMCYGVVVSLTYYTCVLHEGLHKCMCYSSGYKLATHMYMLLACMTVRVIHLHLQNIYIRNNVSTLMNKI